MAPPASLALIAAAGSGKTEGLVRAAILSDASRTLITTYTNRNASQLSDRICGEAGMLPQRIHVLTWFEFLLRHCIRPYQNACCPMRTRSINFDTQKPRYVPKSRFREYFYDRGQNVYQDRASELACHLNDETGGAVVSRLRAIYGAIFVDELQDLSGYDLTLVEAFLRAGAVVTMVGDPRQCTYTTNRGNKNSRYKGSGIVDWVDGMRRRNLLNVEHLTLSYRCSAAICRFSDGLYPEYPSTRAMYAYATHHDGVFWLRPRHVQEYYARYSPQGLRWDKRSKAAAASGLPCENIGVVKGCTYDRVLIFATDPMVRYLESERVEEAGDRAKLYVAVTRARHSVAFVVDAKGFSSRIAREWTP